MPDDKINKLVSALKGEVKPNSNNNKTSVSWKDYLPKEEKSTSTNTLTEQPQQTDAQSSKLQNTLVQSDVSEPKTDKFYNEELKPDLSVKQKPEVKPFGKIDPRSPELQNTPLPEPSFEGELQIKLDDIARQKETLKKSINDNMLTGIYAPNVNPDNEKLIKLNDAEELLKKAKDLNDFIRNRPAESPEYKKEMGDYYSGAGALLEGSLIGDIAKLGKGAVNNTPQFWYDIKKGFTSPLAKDFFTVGLNELKRNFDVLDIAKRSNADPNSITTEEQKVLDAYNTFEQLKQGKDLPFSYQVGQGVVEMIPYMAQFAATGGVGAGVEGAVSSYLTKKLGTNLIKNSVLKGTANAATKATGRIIGAIAQNALLPQSPNSFVEREMRNYEIGQSPEGQTAAKMIEDPTSSLSNFIKSQVEGIVSTAIENGSISEGLFRKLANKQSLGKLSTFSKKLEKAVGWNNPGFEFIEEFETSVFTNFINGDQEWSEIFNPKTQGVTFMTVMLTGGAFKAANLIEKGVTSYQLAQPMNKSKDDIISKGSFGKGVVSAMQMNTIKDRLNGLSNLDWKNQDEQTVASALTYVRNKTQYDVFKGFERENKHQQNISDVQQHIEFISNPKTGTVDVLFDEKGGMFYIKDIDETTSTAVVINPETGQLEQKKLEQSKYQIQNVSKSEMADNMFNQINTAFEQENQLTDLAENENIANEIISSTEQESQENNQQSQYSIGQKVTLPDGEEAVISNPMNAGGLIEVQRRYSDNVETFKPEELNQPIANEVQNGENTVSEKETEKGQIDTTPELPKNKDGAIDFNSINDPGTFASALNMEFASDSQEVLNKLIQEANQQLKDAENIKSVIEKRIAIKKANEKLAMYEQVNTILNPTAPVETTKEKRERILKERTDRGEVFALQQIPETLQKYTINVDNMDLPLAPEIPVSTIDFKESFGDEEVIKEFSKAKLLEVRGRNMNGKLEGTVVLYDTDGKRVDSFYAIFNDNTEGGAVNTEAPVTNTEAKPLQDLTSTEAIKANIEKELDKKIKSEGLSDYKYRGSLEGRSLVSELQLEILHEKKNIHYFENNKLTDSIGYKDTINRLKSLEEKLIKALEIDKEYKLAALEVAPLTNEASKTESVDNKEKPTTEKQIANETENLQAKPASEKMTEPVSSSEVDVQEISPEEQAQMDAEFAAFKKSQEEANLPSTPESKISNDANLVLGDKVKQAEKIKSRQLPIQNKVEGKETNREFATNIPIKGKLTVIDVSELQPSHIDSQRNPKHGIPEAQPKERNDKASDVESTKIANNPNWDKLANQTLDVYHGAPTVNARGEVIQGNNRSEALRKYWEYHSDDKKGLKQYLIDNAEELGLNASDIENIGNPVLVNMVDVSDSEAIKLGQYTAQDLETGGKRRITPKETLRKLNTNDIGRFVEIITNGNTDDETIRESIRRNAYDAIKYLSLKKAITDTQFQSAFNPNNNQVTKEALDDLTELLKYNLFVGAEANFDQYFDRIPYRVQNALIKTSHLKPNNESDSLNPFIQEAIKLYNTYMSETKNGDVMTLEQWSNSIDMFTGESPFQKYSELAFVLSKMFITAKTEKEIAEKIKKYYQLVNGITEGMFPEPSISMKQALNILFNFTGNLEKYVKRQTNTGNDTSDDKRAVEGERNNSEKRGGSLSGNSNADATKEKRSDNGRRDTGTSNENEVVKPDNQLDVEKEAEKEERVPVIGIGDLHGENPETLKQDLIKSGVIDSNLNWITDKTVIQIGDVTDRGQHSEELIDFLNELQSKSNGKLIRILGNHDLAHIQGKAADLKGIPNEMITAKLREAVENNRIVAAWSEGDTIYTHAGIDLDVFDFYIGLTPSEIVNNLNEKLKYAVRRNNYNDEIFKNNGIFWKRGDIENSQFRQVVGHTVKSKEHTYKDGDRVKYIDTGRIFGGSNELFNNTIAGEVFAGDVLNEITSPTSKENLQVEPKTEPKYGDKQARYDELKAKLKGKLNNLNAGIDPELFAIGVEMAAIKIEMGVKKFSQFAKEMVEELGEAIKPYLKSIYNGVRDLPEMEEIEPLMDEYNYVKKADIEKEIKKAIQIEKESSNFDNNLKPENNVSDRTGSSQRNSEDSPNEIPTDKGDVSNAGGRSGQSGNGVNKTSRKPNKPASSNSSGGLFADLFGEQSDNEVYQPEESSISPQDNTGDTDGRGSSIFGSERQDDESNGGEGNQEVDGRANEKFSERTARKIEEQKNAEKIPVILNNEENIRQTLPLLLAEQQDDVIKAENRFFDESHKTKELAYGKGILFTNGTGTGKTFTGLGIVKRFEKQGKKNILIVVPSEAKIKDWINDAVKINTTVTALQDTQDKGEGINITTYASFRANDNLKNRDFDLIIYDESHRLMEEKTGKSSATTAAHYQNSNVSEWQAYYRLTSIHPVWIEYNNVLEEYRKMNNTTNNSVGMDMMEEQYQKHLAKVKELETRLDVLKQQKEELEPGLRERAKKAYENTKVVFLSATPFKGHFNLRYANKVLFDWGEETTYASASRGMSRVDAESQFFLDNFGSAYEWKFHRLQTKQKSNAEAIALQEVEFAQKLMQQGVMSGRAIESERDYSREYPLVALDRAEDMNKAFNDVFNYVTNEFEGLRDAAREVFYNYNYTTKLFESLKASLVIPRINKHLDLNRKVVIFHRRKQSGVTPPFDTILINAKIIAEENKNNAFLGAALGGGKEAMRNAEDEYNKVLNQIEIFRNKYADLLEYEKTLNYDSAIDQLLQAFGDKVVFVNGDTSKKDKVNNIKSFNDDNSNTKILVVQEEAGKEGISLHDVTGNHQRVLMSLSMPISSTTALQIEGRIFRIGQETDAIFEYPLLGLDMEIEAFGRTINKKLSTTENLAMGNQARDLLRSFAEGVLFHSKPDDPNTEQGKGGKEYDKKTQGTISEFQKAILVYSSNQKTRGKRDEREGIDYYATPEPIGQKMVEWLDIREGDSDLEPSAGHGAIAMWFPETSNVTAVEPSFKLYSKLNARSGGGNRKIVNDTFENLNVINKFNGIAMNPPFGTGGKMAMDHLEKAFHHLKTGGRIVALIPRGKMDERFDKFMYGTDEKGNIINSDASLVATINLPSVTFQQAGTSVSARIVVVDKIKSLAEIRREIYDKDVQNVISYRGATLKPKEQVEEEAKQQYYEQTSNLYTTQYDLSDIKTVEELFDSIEFLTIPSRNIAKSESNVSQTPVNNDVKSTSKEGTVSYKEGRHTKTGEILHLGVINDRVEREEYDNISKIAKNLGGYYSKYAKGFVFDSKETADKFVNKVNTPEVSFRKVSPIGFYSTVENALDAIKQDKGTPEQFKAMLLKNGAKQAELDWMGWDEHFADSNKKVTKADIQDFIDSNNIDVQEVVKGDYSNRNLEAVKVKPFIYNVVDTKTNEIVLHNVSQSRADEFIDNAHDGTNTKFSKYQEPGGENYKELLLTMLYKVTDAVNKASLYAFSKPFNELTENQQKAMRANNTSFPEEFKSSHFSEPNILAHVRFKEYNTPNEKILFVEEFQSDWAEEGRKEGFKRKEFVVTYFKDSEGVKTKTFKSRESAEKFVNEIGRENISSSGIRELNNGNVPDMPFKQTDKWVKLALRRMIRYAAENGFDRIAWTNGEQQEARYDLSKQLSSIHIEERSGKYLVDVWDKSNNKYIDRRLVRDKNELSELIGKDMTNKFLIEREKGYKSDNFISEDPYGNAKMSFEGLDLKVGGEGMKAFYDSIIPSTASKLIKPFGGKVENIEMSTGTQQSFPINQSLKETALGGLPLFNTSSGNKLPEEPTAQHVVDNIDLYEQHYQKITDSVREFAKNMKVTVKVVRTKLNLPLYIQKEISRMDDRQGRGRYPGVYDRKTKTIYIVAHECKNTTEAQRTAAHEIIAHYGLRNLLGNEFAPTMELVYRNMTEAQRNDIITKYGYNKDAHTDIADEFTARMAEGQEIPSWFAVIIAKIRNFIRKTFGFDLNMSEKDIVYLLWKSKNKLEEDATAGEVMDYIIKDDHVEKNAIKFQIIGEKGAEMIDNHEVVMNNLRVAKEMESTNKDAKTIRLTTGWEKGVDGKWRYEIPSIKTTKKFDDLDLGTEISLSQAVNSKELFDAYPELKNVRVEIMDTRENSGSYNPKTKRIEISTYTPSLGNYEYSEQGINDGFKSVLIHEIQHAIQEIEGFSIGGNPMSSASSFTFEEQKERAELIKSLPELESLMYDTEYSTQTRKDASKAYENAKNRIEELSATNRYKKLSGEVEARNVQSRMNMTDEQRRNTLLADTEDVARDQQIILREGGGMAMSVSDLPETITINGVERPTTNSNGKPIATTEQGIRNFYEWFGDSKVVDEQGRPLVVYHGTVLSKGQKPFSEFNIGELGIHFGNLEQANKRAKRFEMIKSIDHGITPYVFDVYLKIENPVYSYSDTRDWSDGFELERVLHKLGSLSNEESEYIGWNMDQDYIRQELIDLGYDGIKYKNSFEGNDNSYIVFYNDQIKSATGNNGDFDSNESNINFKRENDTPPEGSTKRYIDSMAKGFTQGIQNKDLPLKLMEEDLVKESGIKLDESNSAYMWSDKYKSGAGKQMQSFERNQIKPLIESIKEITDKTGKDIKAVSDYLLAKHSIERHEAGEVSALSEEVDADWNMEKATAIVDEFENSVPKPMVDDLWDKVRKATRFSLDYSFSSGFMDLDTYDKLSSQYQFYVPLRGWDFTEKINPLEYYNFATEQKNGSTFQNPLIKAKGRTSKPADPLPHIVAMGESAIIYGMKNQFKLRLLTLARQHQDRKDVFNLRRAWEVLNPLTGEWTETYDPPQDLIDERKKIYEEIKKLEKSKKNKTVDEVIKIDEQISLLKENIKIRNTRNRKNEMYLPKSSADQRVVNVWERGIKYELSLTDPEVANVVNGIDNKVWWLMGNERANKQWYANFNRWLSANFTSKNPAFIAPNMIRDLMFATTSHWIQDDGTLLEFYKNIPKAASAIHRYIRETEDMNNESDKELKTFFEFGGATGYTQLKDLQKIADNIQEDIFGKKGFRKVSGDAQLYTGLHHLGKLMDYTAMQSEMISRFATYLAAKKVGKTTFEAIDMAKNITVNFDRKGEWSGILGALYAFFNPSVQGVNVASKLYKKNKLRFIAACLMPVIFGFVNSFLLSLTKGDDDDYPTDFELSNNIMFRTGEGYTKIPLPPFFRAFWGMGSQLHRAMVSGETETKDAVFNIMDGIVNATSPINIMSGTKELQRGKAPLRPIVPTWAVPSYDLLVNEDFKGDPVFRELFTKELEKYTPDSEKGFKGTNKFLQDATKNFNKLGGGNEFLPAGTDPTGLTKSNSFKKFIFDWNPAIIEHVIEYYTGGRGKFVNDINKTVVAAANKEIEFNSYNIPIANRFYSTSNAKKDIASEYYGIKDRLNTYEHYLSQAKSAIKSGEPDKQVVPFVEMISETDMLILNEKDEFVSKRIKMINEKLDSNPSAAEIKELRLKKQELMKEFIEEFNSKIEKGD